MDHAPSTAKEAADIIRAGGPFVIRGTETKRDFGCPMGVGETIFTRNLSGIVEWSPEDLVTVVRAGTLISELQAELATRNQCLPLPPSANGVERLTAGMTGTVGGLVSANLPTRWDSATNSVRYWVLGMTIVRADGAIARCGSKAVKNVAGYDAQKLFIGAWGTLGLITEVILRVKTITGNPEPPIRCEWDGSAPLMVCRTPLSEGPAFAAGIPNSVLGTQTGTIWAPAPKTIAPPERGWAIFAGHGRHNFGGFGPNEDLMIRVKDRLDPDRKFNPGQMGIF
ncbi:MAG: FAD-binding protein [Fimbriimonadales bacterium]